MCIIAIKPKNKKMWSDDQLAVMFANNPDGAGFMFYDYDSKKVVIKKGFMTLKDLTKALRSRDFTGTNLVLHFRIGTSGLNDAYNCHPFPVYGKNALKTHTDLGVAHNGVLKNYIPPKTSKINDTQVFINYVLANLKPGFIYDKDKKMLLEEVLDTNKLAFLDDKNKVVTIGYFIEDGGYIYSNTSYKPHTYTYRHTTCVSTPSKSTVGKTVGTNKGTHSVSTTKKVTSSDTKNVSLKTGSSSKCVYDLKSYDDYDGSLTYDDFWSWWDTKH